MKKGIWTGILTILLLVCLPWNIQAGAKPQKPEMTLEWGFQGMVESGSCVPVYVTVTNGGSAFEGKLEMEVPIGASQYGSISNQIIMVDGNMESTRDRVTTWIRDITLEANETRTEIFYLSFPTFCGTVRAYLKEGNTIVQTGELTKDFSDNADRAIIGIVEGTKKDLEMLDGIRLKIDEYGISDVFTYAQSMKTEEIPTDWNGLGQVDVLLLDEKNQLSQEQWLAVCRWKQDGGVLLIRKDGSFAELFQNFLLSEESSVLYEGLNEKWGYIAYDNYETSQTPVRKRPGVMKYFVLILLYACLAGPILYLILKKWDKRQYLWRCVAVLAVVFLGIVAFMGRSTRLSAPVLTKKQVFIQEDQIWSEMIQLGVQAPHNSTYQLYLDNKYHLVQVGSIGDDGDSVNVDTADSVEIYEKEDSYKLTFRRQPVFSNNTFCLSREKMLMEEEKIQIHADGENEKVEGTWKNPTEYTIQNVILVLANRIMFLDDLEAQGEGSFAEPIYSYGTGGLEVVLREYMDLTETEYPEYELDVIIDKIWENQKNTPNTAYLLGIIENVDDSFQKNSGYDVYGITIFGMPVEIDFTKENGQIFCSNAEMTAEVISGSATSGTNLMYGKDAVLEYALGEYGTITKLEMFDPQYDEERYFMPFIGTMAFYNWEKQQYDVIDKKQREFSQKELEPYLSDTGALRVSYQLKEGMDVTSKNCTLPCLKVEGKVVESNA